MSKVIFNDIIPIIPTHSYSTKRTQLIFSEEAAATTTPVNKTNFAVPIFQIQQQDGKLQDYVLIKHLSQLWNYPSSYQLITKLINNTVLTIHQFKKTDEAINHQLNQYSLIEVKDIKFELFYIALEDIYSVINNKHVFYQSLTAKPRVKSQAVAISASGDTSINSSNAQSNKPDEKAQEEQEEEDEDESDESDEEDEEDEVDDEDVKTPKPSHHIHKYKKNESTVLTSSASNDDIITVSQAFPQFGIVDSVVQFNHAQFNSLNPLTKLNYYKTLPSSSLHKFLPNNKLTFSERELLLTSHNYYSNDSEDSKKQQQQIERKLFRKPIGKSKKHNIHVDPNTIDLNESVIPGQGYIQEFNINHICKVPNYYITSNHQPAASASTPDGLASPGQPAASIGKINMKKLKLNSTSNSSFLFNDNIKMSKNIQQLIFSNDSDNYHHAKYYYTKSYRGPGSGNYKDAALMNKINKIKLTNDPIKKIHKKKISTIKSRYNHSLKGLLHEKFNNQLVETVFAKQRKFTEDYSNLEMLHNNLQFNVLLNTYRHISNQTWKNYFKFKTTDFEQLKASQVEQREIELRKQAIENHNQWIEQEKNRQEQIKLILDQERAEFESLQREHIQKQKSIEEKKRQRQLEDTFNDPFISDSNKESAGEEEQYEALNQEFQQKQLELSKKFEAKKREFLAPIPPPVPVETPQFDIINRFSLPTIYPEIVKNLPLELRQESIEKDDVPSIKKPIRYISTYAQEGIKNPEFVTKVEMIKLPNANSVGWDNLRKFKHS
ncbi:uncharacterized protein SPAPADRAFT_49025 [Spathaspora passalidarum NRRL Y-27907]|uniref:Uncharacterized protein n=1 Tax=Spathaspora passalidarum (strain NRRL Y-27907 / 11-Y1) TaxID=619300 RepID=G3AJM8_SPAPN|nr:uncharacterized protein SPAPADRAFT_49025 [Spathaspora passalidarum NRRL Y-27907]EGW33929.1 hypothetical protein SPAPADRAFT_49025 [Spathaspora passalidarum NRRL Y-27907]